MGRKNQYVPQSIIHPGKTLQEKLEEMGIGPKEFAIRTGKPEKTITAVLKGNSSITPEMAVAFEKVTKIPARFWLDYQTGYDEYIAREKRKQVIEEATEWAKKFPVKEMIKKGWINEVHSLHEKTEALLAFFGFSNHHAWKEYYFHQQLKVAFRISLASTSAPYAISAWLRKGELQASEIRINEYSEKKFKTVLPFIKSIMAKQPANFFSQLQNLCLEAGVKVVYTPCLPKAPISGCTRWLNNTPLIQMSGRYNRNDSFWFSFFHEAGHILLHGKKDIFLEKVEYSGKDRDKEKQADEFAVKWTLSRVEEAEILSSSSLEESSIVKFAAKFNTHPAIIIGRLQHNNVIPYYVGRKFIVPIVFEE